jgi:hypothetical protein
VRYSTQIRPIGYLKANAAKVLEEQGKSMTVTFPPAHPYI